MQRSIRLLRRLILAGLVTSPGVADPFTRITTGPVVSAASGISAAWGDFNNDGYPDLFIGTNSGLGQLYVNNRDGTFSNAPGGFITSIPENIFGAAWGDYNNDGFLDLFTAVYAFSGTGRFDSLYRNNGGSSFTAVTGAGVSTTGGSANNCAWVDYDNDGQLDLFVANSSPPSYLFHNNGDGTFARVTTGPIVTAGGNAQGAAWADYDNDGKPDLFVSRVNSANLLFHNEGKGVFTLVTGGPIATDIGTCVGVAWADYDNDGYPDLFVVNAGGPNFLYHNNGNGTFTKVTTGAIVTDLGDGRGCAWADYDNDGFLDLIVANRNGVNFLYHNNGDGTFTRVLNSVVATDVADGWTPAWADYDNDGFMDLFVGQLQNYANRLFHNSGNANAQLTITCVGTRSNRAAIGAKVRVHATIRGRAMWQLREISGGDGLGTQNDLRAHFGLGDAAAADQIRIEWPSGTVQTLTNIRAGQFLTVTEPLPVPPSFASQPLSVTVNGGTLALTVAASGADSYQWMLNGTAPVPGATGTTLLLKNVGSGAAGTYTCVATNAFGSTTSTPATVVVAPSSNPGRLINLSVLASVPASQTLTAGFVVGGSGTAGSQSLLIRGIGPALAAFGVNPLLTDPRITIYRQSDQVIIGGNDNWASTPANQAAVLTADSADTGFPLTDPASLDAATVALLPITASGYTVALQNGPTTPGSGLAEIYDNTSSYTASTPRLINLSALYPLAAGTTLTAGFVVGGTTARTFLLRAVGPSLAQFGVQNVLRDPVLTLNATTGPNKGVIGGNTAWNGDAQLAATAGTVGAFAFSSALSLDCAMVITLPPGSYTAQVGSGGGNSGTALVELYEVP